MRLIAKTAILLAITAAVSLAPATAKAQDSGHRVAVIDVAKIFKTHAGIKSQVTAVENSLKAYDAQLQAKREELKNEAAKLKTFDVNTSGYIAQEEKLASMDSKLRLDMARKRKELADAEAKIYYDNYQLIAEGVKLIAQHNKINMVLRYNSEDMDRAVGESVIRGVMKNIVYHDTTLDMTGPVMQYLDSKIAAVPGGVQR